MKEEQWFAEDIKLRKAKLEMEKERDSELKDILVMFKGIVDRIYPEPIKSETHILEPEQE